MEGFCIDLQQRTLQQIIQIGFHILQNQRMKKETYEKGKELGNEKGYVVRMSRNYLEYLELGLIKD
jgi:hypothetical protein